MKKLLFSTLLASTLSIPSVQATTEVITNTTISNESRVTQDTIIPAPYNDTGAVVLLFHRFGEEKYPSTNVRIEQLDAIIAYLKDNNFTVLPLQDAIKAVQAGAVMPPKTIVITIDDAFKSTYTVAYPKFKEAGFPFTVFVSTKHVNANNPNYMSWEDIADLSDYGVDIQNHTVSNPYMVNKDIIKMRAEILDAQNSITENIGVVPKTFAYPYGEADTKLMALLKDMGYTASFGQYSSVMNTLSNMHYLPRFSINENYATLKRLKLILNTKPLPVTNLKPENPLITDTNPPEIQFEVSQDIKSLKGLNCYQSGVGKVSLHKSDRTIHLNFSQPFKKGRTRINCTLRNPDGAYRWYGMQYLVKD